MFQLKICIQFYPVTQTAACTFHTAVWANTHTNSTVESDLHCITPAIPLCILDTWALDNTVTNIVNNCCLGSLCHGLPPSTTFYPPKKTYNCTMRLAQYSQVLAPGFRQLEIIAQFLEIVGNIVRLTGLPSKCHGQWMGGQSSSSNVQFTPSGYLPHPFLCTEIMAMPYSKAM